MAGSIDRRKLACVLALLSSDKQGEVLSAAAAASRLVRSAGMDWNELLSPPAPANSQHPPEADRRRRTDLAMLRAAQARRHVLNTWEIGFLISIEKQIARGRALTLKQRIKLAELATR
jgi:hypothetical protein